MTAIHSNSKRFPRARGDVPSSHTLLTTSARFSPRTRGCSLGGGGGGGVGVGFPRARGDVPTTVEAIGKIWEFSPRTRGCSYSCMTPKSAWAVFPAHAGMFHCAQASIGKGRRFSPRTRGCSEEKNALVDGWIVFPAHAGMFRSLTNRSVACRCFPRARGDVPSDYRGCLPGHWFSPRTRGCSLIAELDLNETEVFPAHAGMFPSGQSHKTKT